MILLTIFWLSDDSKPLITCACEAVPLSWPLSPAFPWQNSNSCENESAARTRNSSKCAEKIERGKLQIY